MSVLVFGDIPYYHAAPPTLEQLNPVLHSALHFITNDKFRTHHRSLYRTAGWTCSAAEASKLPHISSLPQILQLQSAIQ